MHDVAQFLVPFMVGVLGQGWVSSIWYGKKIAVIETRLANIEKQIDRIVHPFIGERES